MLSVRASDADETALYTVKDGNKVDAKTLQGWKTWRALACERCHGAEQEGLVGPPLVESMKALSKEDFHKVMMNGRPEKGMPPFNASPMVNAELGRPVRLPEGSLRWPDPARPPVADRIAFDARA